MVKWGGLFSGEHAEHRSYDATCLYRRCDDCAAIQTTTKETR